MKVALLTVHGMGKNNRDYAVGLNSSLKKKLGVIKSDCFSQYVIYYQDLLQGNEEEIWGRVENIVHYDNLREYVLYGFADAVGLENGKELPNSVYEASQLRVADQMMAARNEHGKDTPLVVIAQSLGGHVMSNFLWDAQLALKARTGHPSGRYPVAGIFREEFLSAMAWSLEDLQYLAGSNLMAFYTTGCNIPIFVAAHKQMNIKSIEAPNKNFRWINLYDPDDVLGWPLQPLGGGYEALVEDRCINSGSGALDFILKSWNPASHTTYWGDNDVIDAVAQDLWSLSN